MARHGHWQIWAERRTDEIPQGVLESSLEPWRGSMVPEHTFDCAVSSVLVRPRSLWLDWKI